MLLASGSFCLKNVQQLGCWVCPLRGLGHKTGNLLSLLRVGFHLTARILILNLERFIQILGVAQALREGRSSSADSSRCISRPFR